jgi:hypothetical protein
MLKQFRSPLCSRALTILLGLVRHWSSPLALVLGLMLTLIDRGKALAAVGWSLYLHPIAGQSPDCAGVGLSLPIL